MSGISKESVSRVAFAESIRFLIMTVDLHRSAGIRAND